MKQNYIFNFKALLKFTACLMFALTPLLSQAQVTIGSNKAPESFSVLELTTTNAKGGLRLPQLTAPEISVLTPQLISNPQAQGLMVYNESLNCIQVWKKTDEWLMLGCETSGQQPLIDGPNIVCGSQSVQLTALPNSGDYTYIWSKDGTIITGANTNSFATSTPGVYTVQYVENGAYSPISSAFTISEKNLPVAKIESGTASLQSGAEGTYTASLAPAGESYTYQWILPTGATLVSQTNNTAKIKFGVIGRQSVQVATSYNGLCKQTATAYAVNIAMNCPTNPSFGVSCSRPVHVKGSTVTATVSGAIAGATVSINIQREGYWQTGGSYRWNIVGGGSAVVTSGSTSVTITIDSSEGDSQFDNYSFNNNYRIFVSYNGCSGQYQQDL